MPNALFASLNKFISALKLLPISVLILFSACNRHAKQDQEQTKIAKQEQRQTKVVPFNTLQTRNPFAHYSSLYSISWPSDDILIVTNGNRTIQAFDAIRGAELWHQEYGTDISNMTANAQHVFVALRLTIEEQNKTKSIICLDLKTGDERTPDGMPQPYRLQKLIWCDEIGALCVVQYNEFWTYSADLLNITHKVPYSGRFPYLSQSGKFILLAEMNESCTLIDVSNGTAHHIYGPNPPVFYGSFDKDQPFLSNAFARGDGPFIRVVDYMSPSGGIFFHTNPAAKPRVVYSGNWNSAAAVHWPSGRMAVSGTKQNLLLLTTSGELLVKIKHAAKSRVHRTSFSPSGGKIALLCETGEVEIYNINSAQP